MLSEISKWILSIAGIICASVIIEFVLPEGQMNKYIKSVLSFIIVFVILMPIPKLLGKEFEYSNIFNYENNIQIDEDYLYQLNLDKINALKQDIENEILDHGYKNVKVYISADIFASQMQYKTINVDLSNLVITENAEHNDITKIKIDITSIIQSYLKIDGEKIYYEN